MPLSSMTPVPFIQEGSEATPGLWNTPFSILSANLQELNTKAIGLASGLVLNGAGDPNSQITAPVGFFYEQIDSANTRHPIWVKKLGSSNTGWASDAGFMGDAGDGQGALQMGPGASAGALNSLAYGSSSFVGPNANQAVAMGFGSTVTGSGGVGLGANSQVYSPNGVGVGINAYVGFRDAGAFGSNVSSNATGAFVVGVGATSSQNSSFIVSATGGSATSTEQATIDFPYTVLGTRANIGSQSTTTGELVIFSTSGAGGIARTRMGRTGPVYSDLYHNAADDSFRIDVNLKNHVQVSAVGVVSVVSKLDLSTATLSLSTYATATAIPSGCFGIVQRTSGLSLIWKSGSSVYVLATSSTSGTA